MATNRDEALSFINPSTSFPIAVLDVDNYLLDNSQIGSFQNEGFLGGLDGGGNCSDAEFGFSLADFRQSPLVGTVEYYDRHNQVKSE
ncbi:unnamed protein product [Ilex paraguariensis]|uniref:Uncharacterized protein n=1 Tax=Ilex paraguariensis TaxID=185542 RepID=A0ABC8RVD6_9AQUA